MTDPKPFFFSEEERRTILYDESSPSAVWMTRRDLHAWVWAQPIAVVDDVLGMLGSVGWQCWIYDVCRPPPGYFHKIRAGKPVDIQPLDESRDLNEPVPIVSFDQDGINYTLRCSPKFERRMQLGPPDQSARIYPRPEGTPPLAVPMAASPHQRVRLGGLAEGPPKPFTRGGLAKLVRGVRYGELDKIFQLYGLDHRMLVKIIERAGVATFPSFNQWSKYDWDDLANDHPKTIIRRLSAKQRHERVDFDLAVRDELAHLIEDENRLHAERARAITERTQATLASRRQTAEERFSAIMQRLAAGEQLDVAIAAEGAHASGVTSIIRDKLKQSMPKNYARMARRVAKAISAGVDISGADRILILQVCSSETLILKGVTSPRLKSIDAASESQLVELALWLASAAEVEEAQRGLEEGFEACRNFPHTPSPPTIHFRSAI